MPAGRDRASAAAAPALPPPPPWPNPARACSSSKRARVLAAAPRRFTDPATGERVDNGQHILMGCYVETLAFLDRIGAADRVRWQSGLKLPMIDRRGHHSVLALPALPSPLHFLAGVLAWDALGWGERFSVLRIGAGISPAKAGHRLELPSEYRCELGWSRTGRHRGCASCSGSRSRSPHSTSRSIKPKPRTSSACSNASSGPIPARPRWCSRRFRSTSCMPNRRARGSSIEAATCASTLRQRWSIDGQRIRGVRVRDEVIEAPIVISTVPWHSFHALFDEVPRRTRADGCQRDRAGEPSDRHRQPVVRRRGDARAARRPAGAELPVDLRSPRHRRRRRVAPLPDLERRGSDRRANQRGADGDRAR